MSDLSRLNPTPHAIAVYASQPLSPVTTRYQAGAAPYLGRTSTGWIAPACLAHSFDHLVGELLHRPRLQRPSRRRAAEKRDELAAPYSITSSARARRFGGTVRSSAFAVLRLITSSYLVGCWTGRSPGFSPLRMRAVYWPMR